MLFQIFAKDGLLTVFIRALHRLEEAVLKVVLQQATTGQWDTLSRALGRGAAARPGEGGGGEDPRAAGGQLGGLGGNHLLPLLRPGHGEGRLHGGCESQPGLEDRALKMGGEGSMLSLP